MTSGQVDKLVFAVLCKKQEGTYSSMATEIYTFLLPTVKIPGVIRRITTDGGHRPWQAVKLEINF